MRIRIVVFFILLVLLAQLSIAKNSQKKKDKWREYDSSRKKSDWENSKKKQGKGEMVSAPKLKTTPKVQKSEEISSTPVKEEQVQTGNTQMLQELQYILNTNKLVVAQNIKNNPDFYKVHAESQHPKYLWIGCSDSRVPAEAIIGAKVGELFVHRNVANQASPGDPNLMAVVEYAVKHLKIENIIVAGHTNCGGIKAALTEKSFGPLQFWLHQIREMAHHHYSEFPHDNEKLELTALIDINVQEQVRKLSKAGVIQEAWNNNQKLNIFGVVYDLQTGLLRPVGEPRNGLEDVPDFQQIFGL